MKLELEDIVEKFTQIARSSTESTPGVGFAFTPDRGQGRKMILMYPSQKIETLEKVKEFSTTIKAVTNSYDVDIAGLMAEIPMKVGMPDQDLAERDLVPSVLLYIDQKYGDVKLWAAAKEDGAELSFVELGTPTVISNILPSLFPMESYGVPVAEA